MFSIYDCATHQRVSGDSYPTAEEANHDYAMNAGHTYIGLIGFRSARYANTNLGVITLLGFKSSGAARLALGRHGLKFVGWSSFLDSFCCESGRIVAS